jgi:hypothetical protein
MQGFSVESKTFGISSSSTLWQDLEAPYKSRNEANLTPRSQGLDPRRRQTLRTWPEKCWLLQDKELCPIRREMTTWTYMQKGETSRKQGNRRRAKEASGWAWMVPGQPAQAGRPSPVQGPFAPSFALAAIQAIYSPLTESHALSNSSSAAEEPRREGHHLGEERVDLVD